MGPAGRGGRRASGRARGAAMGPEERGEGLTSGSRWQRRGEHECAGQLKRSGGAGLRDRGASRLFPGLGWVFPFGLVWVFHFLSFLFPISNQTKPI